MEEHINWFVHPDSLL